MLVCSLKDYQNYLIVFAFNLSHDEPHDKSKNSLPGQSLLAERWPQSAAVLPGQLLQGRLIARLRWTAAAAAE